MLKIFPELKTERLILRKIIPEDKQKIFDGLSDNRVIEYYGVSYQSYDETQIQMDWYDELLNSDTGIWWAIEFVGNKELLGACGFNDWDKVNRKIEIGAWLCPVW